MTELESQFLTAIADLRVLLDTVENSLPWYDYLPGIGLADQAGRREQTAPYVSSATQLLKKWAASTTDEQRRSLVKQARDLVSNAREQLHGGQGSTTYGKELSDQAAVVLHTAADAASSITSGIKTGLLVAAGVLAVLVVARR